MTWSFHEEERALTRLLENFREDLSLIRTGRASPALVEKVKVDYYGSSTPLQQLASISAPEPLMLVIQAWDAQSIPDIERALRTSDLGVNPVVEGQLIRVHFPHLTEERREELVKLTKQKAEQARIHVRGIREDAMKKIRKAQEKGEISEDEAEFLRKKLQQSVEQSNEDIEDILTKKHEEIRHI